MVISAAVDQRVERFVSTGGSWVPFLTFRFNGFHDVAFVSKQIDNVQQTIVYIV